MRGRVLAIVALSILTVLPAIGHAITLVMTTHHLCWHLRHGWPQ